MTTEPTTAVRQACDCRDWSCGLPPCDGCNEDHGGHDVGGKHLCRDCFLEFTFDQMTCAVCGKMRTQTEGIAGDLADYFWGKDHRCACRVFVSKRLTP